MYLKSSPKLSYFCPLSSVLSNLLVMYIKTKERKADGVFALLGSGCNWLLPITKYSENFWCQFISLSQFKEGFHLGKIKTPAWRERGSIPI